MKKTIIWKGPQRMIPYVGIAERDKRIAMETELANSYIDQGLAIDVKPAKPKPIPQED